jgi:23S rRNA pseudouridine1911/1915/1917 synthase
VHLSAIGHPVVGDNIYGDQADREFKRKYGALNRYFLHAAELQFEHPTTGQPMKFRSALPEELQQALATVRSH